MKEIKVTCPNCNGKGEIPHYHYNCQGICFRCLGKGYIIEKQYTEQELEKINKRISKKQLATEKELRGYKNTDILYLIAENNTFNIKDQIKSDGGKWNQYFNEWTFENDNLKDKYNLIPVKYDDAEMIHNKGIKELKIDRAIMKPEKPENDNSEDMNEMLDNMFSELGW